MVSSHPRGFLSFCIPTVSNNQGLYFCRICTPSESLLSTREIGAFDSVLLKLYYLQLGTSNNREICQCVPIQNSPIIHFQIEFTLHIVVNLLLKMGQENIFYQKKNYQQSFNFLVINFTSNHKKPFFFSFIRLSK